MPSSLLPLPKPFWTAPLSSSGYGRSGSSGPTIDGRSVRETGAVGAGSGAEEGRPDIAEGRRKELAERKGSLVVVSRRRRAATGKARARWARPRAFGDPAAKHLSARDALREQVLLLLTAGHRAWDFLIQVSMRRVGERDRRHGCNELMATE